MMLTSLVEATLVSVLSGTNSIPAVSHPGNRPKRRAFLDNPAAGGEGHDASRQNKP